MPEEMKPELVNIQQWQMIMGLCHEIFGLALAVKHKGNLDPMLKEHKELKGRLMEVLDRVLGNRKDVTSWDDCRYLVAGTLREALQIMGE